MPHKLIFWLAFIHEALHIEHNDYFTFCYNEPYKEINNFTISFLKMKLTHMQTCAPAASMQYRAELTQYYRKFLCDYFQ